MTIPLPVPANTGWTKAMNETLYATDVNPCSRLLYLIVQSFTRERRPWCTVQHATLARAYGASERQVQRLLDDLAQHHWLKVRPWGHGRAKAYLPIAGLSPSEIARLGPPQPPTPPTTYPTFMSGNDQDEVSPNPTLPPALPDTNVAAYPTFVSPVKEDRLTRPEKTRIGADAPAAAEVSHSSSSTVDETVPAPTTSPPLQASTRPKSSPASATGGPKQQQVIDLIRAGGAPLTHFDGRDGKAVKYSEATPEQIAACYLDLWYGRYGDGFQRGRLRVHAVVTEILDGYLAQQAHPTQVKSGLGRERPRTGYTASRNGPLSPEFHALAVKAGKESGW